MKFLPLLLITLLFLQVFVEATSVGDVDTEGTSASLYRKPHHHHLRRPRLNCGSACARRCSKSSRPNLCNRACGTCCARCHCVPPGTYGNHHLCPCYANLRTHGNRPKCP